jgi:UDP-sugar diphosphatase
MLKKIKIIEVYDDHKPKFIKPIMVKTIREDNEEILWEMVKSNGSVHVLVDNIETNELMIVKQIRIPVLFNDNSKEGVVYEVCAGLIDKNKSTIEIAREEIIEEMGYEIPIENIEYLKTLKSSVGSSGSSSHMYIATVEEKHKVSEGGGISNEDIKVVRIPYNNVESFLKEEFHTDSTTMFLIYYWLFNRK